MENSEKLSLDVLREVALEGIKEQRRARRWGIFFKIIILFYLLILLLLYFSLFREEKIGVGLAAFTAVVDIDGAIMADSNAGADAVIPALREAFENAKTKGIIIRCNSPGGSPVQAGYIHDEIRRLRVKHPDTPVYAVITDICTSGGYFIVSAADKIYASETSLVGSIGVRMDSFGVVGAMEKIGVENRRIIAGEHKAMLDPFSPRNPEEEIFVRRMLEITHRHLINAVKAGRGERLQDDPDIFSGLFWIGKDAKTLGLVDGFGSASYVAREIFKAEQLVVFSPGRTLLDRLVDQMGVEIRAMIMESGMWRLSY